MQENTMIKEFANTITGFYQFGTEHGVVLHYLIQNSSSCYSLGKHLSVNVNRLLRAEIATALDCKTDKTLERVLKDFTEAGIIEKDAKNVYILNPNIFGTTEWRNVVDVSVTVEFKNDYQKLNITRTNRQKSEEDDE